MSRSVRVEIEYNFREVGPDGYIRHFHDVLVLSDRTSLSEYIAGVQFKLLELEDSAQAFLKEDPDVDSVK